MWDTPRGSRQCHAISRCAAFKVLWGVFYWRCQPTPYLALQIRIHTENRNGLVLKEVCSLAGRCALALFQSAPVLYIDWLFDILAQCAAGTSQLAYIHLSSSEGRNLTLPLRRGWKSRVLMRICSHDVFQATYPSAEILGYVYCSCGVHCRLRDQTLGED